MTLCGDGAGIGDVRKVCLTHSPRGLGLGSGVHNCFLVRDAFKAGSLFENGHSEGLYVLHLT